jgi:hypothetical protein
MMNPRMMNIMSNPTNDPKFLGMKGITSLFIDKTAAVRATGDT